MCASSASSRRLAVFSVGSALLSVTIGSTNAGRTANSRSETENDFLACDGKDLQHEIAAFPFEHAVERQFARLASWDEQTVAVVAFIEESGCALPVPAAADLPHHAVLHGGFFGYGIGKFERRVVVFQQAVAVAEPGERAGKRSARRYREGQRVRLSGEQLHGRGRHCRAQVAPQLFQRDFAVIVHIRFRLAIQPKTAGKRAGKVRNRACRQTFAVVIPAGFKSAGGGQHVNA